MENSNSRFWAIIHPLSFPDVLLISIRTMTQVDDLVYVHAGGAIVADSTPEQEYDESIAKAAGMMRALGCEKGSSHQPPALGREAPARPESVEELATP